MDDQHPPQRSHTEDHDINKKEMSNSHRDRTYLDEGAAVRAAAAERRQQAGFRPTISDRHSNLQHGPTAGIRDFTILEGFWVLCNAALALEWFSIFLISLTYLLAATPPKRVGLELDYVTPLSSLFTWLEQEFLNFQESPILRRSRTLYPVVAPAMIIVHSLEVFGVLGDLLSLKIRRLFDVRQPSSRWLARTFVLWCLWQDYQSIQRSRTVSAAILLWSLTGFIQLTYAWCNYRSRSLWALRCFVDDFLLPATAAAESYLIYSTIPETCAWWPSQPLTLRDLTTFVFHPEAIVQTRAFRRALFHWTSQGIYSKTGEYFRSAVFFGWTSSWIGQRFGGAWLGIAGVLLVASLTDNFLHNGRQIVLL